MLLSRRETGPAVDSHHTCESVGIDRRDKGPEIGIRTNMEDLLGPRSEGLLLAAQFVAADRRGESLAAETPEKIVDVQSEGAEIWIGARTEGKHGESATCCCQNVLITRMRAAPHAKRIVVYKEKQF